MSREIEYRGKRIDNNEWVYGGYYKHLKRTPSPIGDTIKEDDWKSLIIKSGFSDWNMPKPLDCFEVNEQTVGQYAELKDKNKKKIYEGDTVKCTHSYISRFDNQYKTIDVINGEVCFSLCGFKINVDKGEHLYNLSDCDNIEIVGNIHKNTEILENRNGYSRNL